MKEKIKKILPPHIYKFFRRLKWNIGIFWRILFVVWNFWSFITIGKNMGGRTARLWGGGKIYLRNFLDVHILLEVFENSYGIDKYYPTVADVGANIGIFSVFYTRKFPGAKISAFEPEPNNFKLLLKNTGPYKNISCHNVAVGSEKGAMRLYLDKINLGRHSFHKDWAGDEESVIVNVEPLKNNFDLIKLDVEGTEYDILKTIPKCKQLVMEIHKVDNEDPKKLIHKLKKNFKVTDLGDNVLSLISYN